MTMKARALAIAGAALIAGTLSAPALAAEPATGTVTEYEPKTEWAGESYGFVPWAVHLFAEEQTLGCQDALCDTYSVNVEHRGKLKITVADDAEVGYVELEVTEPSGAVVLNSGEDSVPTVYTRNNAPVGTYTVEVHVPALIPEVEDPAYSGTVLLNDGIPKPRPTE